MSFARILWTEITFKRAEALFSRTLFTHLLTLPLTKNESRNKQA